MTDAAVVVFCEYALLPHAEDEFRRWARSHADWWRGAQLLESADQPGLMLEIWHARDRREADRIQKERLDERSQWMQMEPWVKGGRAGIRIWTFQPFV